MASVVLEDVRKSFGRTEAVRGVSLDIRDREFVVFVGPSGCGKSTLLRLIAGLEDITSGTISFDGERVNALPPARRGIAMVFQSYALYPHMSVHRNMAFGLRRSGLDRAGVDARVREAAGILQLTELLDRLPRELSGGQRQRVAIGRSIVRDPKVFLFDEPLSNLDAALRVQTRLEIARLHREMSATMIYVTHDQVEAMTLADRIVVLNEGRVEQFGAPLELYHAPANRFVATFLGSPTMNIVEAIVADAQDGRVTLRRGERDVPLPLAAGSAGAGATVSLGVRPEQLRVVGPGEGTFRGEVDVLEALGESHLVHVREVGGEMIVARLSGDPSLRPGERVELAFDPAAAHLFAPDGTALPRTAP